MGCLLEPMGRSRSRSPRGRSPDRSDRRYDDRRSRSPYERGRSPPPDGRNRDECDEISLDDSEVAYLLGRGGQTKQRLAKFSGARLEFGGNNDSKTGEIWGSAEARDLAKLAID